MDAGGSGSIADRSTQSSASVEVLCPACMLASK